MGPALGSIAARRRAKRLGRESSLLPRSRGRPPSARRLTSNAAARSHRRGAPVLLNRPLGVQARLYASHVAGAGAGVIHVAEARLSSRWGSGRGRPGVIISLAKSPQWAGFGVRAPSGSRTRSSLASRSPRGALDPPSQFSLSSCASVGSVTPMCARGSHTSSHQCFVDMHGGSPV